MRVKISRKNILEHSINQLKYNGIKTNDLSTIYIYKPKWTEYRMCYKRLVYNNVKRNHQQNKQ